MSSFFLSLYLSIYLKRYVALFQPTTCLLLVYLGHWVIGGLRHFCLVVENNNHFPHSYFQAVLCDQKASPANCRAASIKVSQFSDNIIFLGHCFSLKEVWDNKYTYTSELLIVLRVAGSWSLSQHAVRQDEGVLYTLDRSTSLSHGYTATHTNTPLLIFIGSRTSWKPQHRPCCVFYSSSLRVTWINHQCVPQVGNLFVTVLDSEKVEGERQQTELRVRWK